MKKLHTLFLVALVAPVLTACGPSPDAVCDHLAELMKKELGDAAAEAFEKDECVESAKKEKEMKGMVEYNKQAKCAMKAESLEDLGKCDSAE